MANTIVYQWQGLDRHGQRVKGEITAESQLEAKNLLRRRGVSAQKIAKQRQSFFGQKDTLNAKDISLITRQIATMLKAGVSLLQTLDMIKEGQAKQSARAMLATLVDDVRSGSQLSSSLRKFPGCFDDLYCDLVATGEQSGALETIFARLALYQEKAEALKSKIKKAMFYPISVLVVAFIVTTILLIFVVPQFEEIFAGFGAELPVFTQMVLALSRFLQHNGVYIALCTFALFWICKRAYGNSKGLRDRIDKHILKVPVVGEILQKGAIARYSRTLATTFAAGIPLIQALESAAGAAGNAVFRDAILFIRKEVSGGIPMYSAMRATNVFPGMVTQMVAIGEESGAVDAMLSKIADIFESDVDDMVDSLTSLLEPLIMAVLGIVIGGLIIAMYLPIFQMGSVV